MKTIADFLDNEYSDAATYMTYRSIPCCIDGLKNSHRKIVYTAKKKNLKSLLKVSVLASTAISESQYIHGDVSLQQVCVTLAKKYTGSNNLPILKGNGNFGTRQMNDASAARYIFAQPQDYFDLLFKKEDDPGLITQMFEGDEIEPRFYVPTLPLVLINGSLGIGVGFSSNILCRDTKNMIEAIRQKMRNKTPEDALFIPQWNGFKGSVISEGSNKWSINGVMELNKRKVHITEIPIPYQLRDYLDILDKLEEDGTIEKYVDLSDSKTDSFEFEVTLSVPESKKDFNTIFKDLKLSNVVTESLTCIDENNAIREFDSPKDIFNYYYKTKIEYLKIRIGNEIKRLEKEAEDLKQVRDFINEVIAGTINLKDKKAVVEKNLKDKGYTIIDQLLSMPLYSITSEKAEEIRKKYEDKAKELEAMKKETPVSLWKKDLVAFEKCLGVKNA